jgi:hypothetical protein
MVVVVRTWERARTYILCTRSFVVVTRDLAEISIMRIRSEMVSDEGIPKIVA